MNGIQVYQNNTLQLTANVSTTTAIDLTTYTPVLKIDFITGSTSITGSTITASGTTSFTVPAAINIQVPHVYEYEIYIEKDLEKYTVISDSYSILPSLIGS